MTRLFLCHIASLALLTLSASTTAAEMSVRVEKPDWYKVLSGNSSWYIALDGEIDVGAAGRVAAALTSAGTDGADVYINSPGGNLLEGMRIGRLIRKANASTYIGTLARDTKSNFAGQAGIKRVAGHCYSACSLAFLGGVYRYATDGDEYGVHRFSSTASPTSVDLDTGQIVAAAIGAYIREMDVDPALFTLMVEHGKQNIRLLSTSELARLNVANNGREKAEWSLEVVEGGQYLRGVQNTVFGQGKAVLLCEKGRIYYYSFYQSGNERAKSIARGGWYHSLLVDGNTVPLPDSIQAKASGEEISAEFPLTREQVLSIAASSKVGHAMQLARDAPTFVGYQIDIPTTASRRVGTFLRNCLAGVR